MHHRDNARPHLWTAVVAIWLLGLPAAVHGQDTENEGARCDTLAAEALDFYRSLPTSFYAGNEAADRWAAQSQQMVGKCQEVVRSCKASLKPERYAEVQFATAKLLYILSERYNLQLLGDLRNDPALSKEAVSTERDRHFKIYLAEVSSLSRQAYAALPANNPLRARALETMAFSLHQAQEYTESVKAYRQFISSYPDDKRIDNVVNALGNAYLDGENYDPGITLLEAALRDHYASDSYPYFVETLRKLRVGKGDLAGFEKTVKQGLLVLPLKAKSTRLSNEVRQVCDRLHLYYGYWEGYGRMAAGDLEGARAAFQKHIDLIDAREQAQKAKGERLRPEYAIDRGRSDLTLSFLEGKAEQPAPRELDLDWVTDSKVVLSDSVGKVVGILFRRVDDNRSQEFMAKLSHACAIQPDFELATVHYLRTGQDLILRRTELQEELSSVGYSAAAGFDPDAQNQALIRAYGVRVGSASFVLVDRQGNLVWLMEDPRKRDVPFVTSVMMRVAKES